MFRNISIVALCVLMSASAFALARTAHDPIYIDDDSDFDGDHGVNGGSGTWLDPYRINGWTISGSDEYGIYIKDTTKYFKIYDCGISNASSGLDTPSGGGIILHNVTDGTAKIYENDLEDNDVGIYLYYTDDQDIYDNNIGGSEVGNGEGIFLLYSDSNDFDDNFICSNDTGVYLDTSDYNNFEGNDVCHSTYAGVYLTDSNENIIYLNDIVYNGTYGIYVTSFDQQGSSDDNSIQCNDIENNTSYGVYLSSYSDGNLVKKNNFTDNGGTSSQGKDDGTNNEWAKLYGSCYFGNYWDEHWCPPWSFSHCGMIRWSCDYSIDGSANNEDDGTVTSSFTCAGT